MHTLSLWLSCWQFASHWWTERRCFILSHLHFRALSEPHEKEGRKFFPSTDSYSSSRTKYGAGFFEAANCSSPELFPRHATRYSSHRLCLIRIVPWTWPINSWKHSLSMAHVDLNTASEDRWMPTGGQNDARQYCSKVVFLPFLTFATWGLVSWWGICRTNWVSIDYHTEPTTGHVVFPSGNFVNHLRTRTAGAKLASGRFCIQSSYGPVTDDWSCYSWHQITVSFSKKWSRAAVGHHGENQTSSPLACSHWGHCSVLSRVSWMWAGLRDNSFTINLFHHHLHRDGGASQNTLPSLFLSALDAASRVIKRPQECTVQSKKRGPPQLVVQSTIRF